MLLADTRGELYPAERRLCFMENTGFLSQEHSLCCWAGNIHGQCVGLALAASCTSDPAPWARESGQGTRCWRSHGLKMCIPKSVLGAAADVPPWEVAKSLG